MNAAVAAVASAAPPVRLLIVSTVDPIVTVMLPHLDAARARGWRVEVACHVTKFRADLERHCDHIHDLPLRRSPVHTANAVGLIKLTNIIRRGNYTIVHCHNPTGGFVGRLAATLASRAPRSGRARPLRVYTAHGFHFHRFGGRVTNLIYRGIETFAGQLLSDAVFVINDEDFHAAAGRVVPRERLFMTGGVGVSARTDFDPASVSADARSAIRSEWGLKDETAPLLTAIGEMIPRKRHGDVLRAFARIADRHPDAVLALVGDGPLGGELQAKATSLGIGDRVRFPGFRRDIAPILAATDVFVFPSRQEGLPCSVQEALSMETAVVTTNVRGCADLVDADCGRLVEPDDIDALAIAIDELIRIGPQARRKLGEAGRSRMLDRYDRQKCVDEWLALYDRLLSSASGGCVVISLPMVAISPHRTQFTKTATGELFRDVECRGYNKRH